MSYLRGVWLLDVRNSGAHSPENGFDCMSTPNTSMHNAYLLHATGTNSLGSEERGTPNAHNVVR